MMQEQPGSPEGHTNGRSTPVPSSRPRATIALVFCLCLASCGPEPYYNADIGVPGIATAEGALAGTWAVHHRIIQLSKTAFFIEEVEGGGDQYFRVQRTWDPTGQSYRESWQLCEDINMEAAGLDMQVPLATIESVVVYDSEPAVNHAAGAYRSDDVMQLWCLRDMPDLRTTPIPTPDDYQDEPQRNWIYDADGDGKFACTIILHGFFEGENYYVNRKQIDYQGVVASPDRLFGLITIQVAWSVLESTIPAGITLHTGVIPSDKARQHPDPKRSWFEQIRLDDDADCDAVRMAIDTEDLSKLRPF